MRAVPYYLGRRVSPLPLAHLPLVKRIRTPSPAELVRRDFAVRLPLDHALDEQVVLVLGKGIEKEQAGQFVAVVFPQHPIGDVHALSFHQRQDVFLEVDSRVQLRRELVDAVELRQAVQAAGDVFADKDGLEGDLLVLVIFCVVSG